MKLKENFVLRQVAGSWIVLPMSTAAVDFNGILTLNDSGALLWQKLEQCCTRQELGAALVAEYEIPLEQALADVDDFYTILVNAGCAEPQ